MQIQNNLINGKQTSGNIFDGAEPSIKKIKKGSKEFMFISRKFIGAYTFMTVIDARTDVRSMVSKFL